jgi:hypothetical protein
MIFVLKTRTYQVVVDVPPIYKAGNTLLKRRLLRLPIAAAL